MNILITGGTGFIGSHLVPALLHNHHTVTLLCRAPEKAVRLFSSHPCYTDSLVAVHSLDAVDSAIDAVINLSGEPIIGQRWTPKRKQILLDSRIGVTRQIVAWMQRQEHPPKVLISGSAIGYYGNQPDHIMDEFSELEHEELIRRDFAARLCHEWEAEALQAKACNTRVCLLRTGVVLAKKQGALAKMWMPFSLGLGGRVGSGKQWLSWVHISDMVALINHVLTHTSIAGPVNATAPHPVPYQVFTETFAQVLSRPHFVPMPSALLQLALGESAQLLLEGQQAVPNVLLDSGFTFQYERLTPALENIVGT